MKGIRRLNKSIDVHQAGQVVPIDFFLPGDARECFGLQAIVVGRIPTDSSVIPCFGEYAFEFGGKKIHPINFIVPYIKLEELHEQAQHRPDLLPLHVPIDENRLISGFYKDLDAVYSSWNMVFQPYRIRFTFHLYTH